MGNKKLLTKQNIFNQY